MVEQKPEAKALDIKAIDCMNYHFGQKFMETHKTAEIQQMFKILFGGGRVPPYRAKTPKEFVGEMDAAGYEKAFICAVKMWSYRDHKLIMDFTADDIYELVKEYPDRLIGVVSYHPFRIEDSLKEIDKAVKQYGFKGVYFHALGHNLRLNDRKLYPCYAKCSELGIPVAMQVGHSLEILPSEVGRPIYIDEVALDFPNLNFVLSHTGWPWVEELIAMAWKHENVYCDISAHLPAYLHKELVEFMNTRGRNKTLFGTNNMGMKLYKDQFMALPIKDETKVKVLRENAVKLYKL